MDLKKELWLHEDIAEFDEYLLTFSKGKEKAEWEKRIANTSLTCLAIPSFEIDRIAREICKGHFASFLMIVEDLSLSHMQIMAKIINRIKSQDLYFYFLDRYVEKCECWASTDCLKFPIKKDNKEQFFNKAVYYLKSEEPFIKRVGLLILMKGFLDDEYIEKTLQIANSLKEENHYYVNMMNAWLIAEAFAKQRDKTLKLLENHSLNDFTINKAISKIRDSYRVSKEDKELVKNFKVKVSK